MCACRPVFSVHEPVALAHSPVACASASRRALCCSAYRGKAPPEPIPLSSHDPSRLATLSAGAAWNDALRREHALAHWRRCRFRRARPRVLRGFGVQQEVFSEVGIRQRVFRFDGSVARGLSLCVGRSSEPAELSIFAQTVPTGASVAVVIVSDAGARKSRLAWELSGSLRPDTWQVIQAEAVSYGRDIPYRLIGRARPEDDRRFRGARSVGRCIRRSDHWAWRLRSRCG